ncbi:phage tail sheath subtilisin-like domain-containing protein [Stenotrophomonas sp. MMGLT7]|uniref:phage tail sheath subtilisin-like domain-containing protein n=1 Tax=Stenotrophomonas sp. MMGLT7 TaxID=2901227 RepID=UPI001E610614|nr:phage tail sheath subtilisin-like domain-containing protein [Stenotrophomonas sp. MMGLT7]MCD7099119.1 phage tail sheath subtilisin-like domain-containing protein [Stenotrophomonas sp. MMGLT7]
MTIVFNDIPSRIRVPGHYVEVDNSEATSNPSTIDQRVLLIGTRLAAGGAAANVIQRINSNAQAVEYFGRDSQLAQMVAAFRGANTTTPLYAVAMNEPAAGVAATGTVTVTGPATAAGTLALYVAGQRLQVGVDAGEAAASIATAIAAAINTASGLPVTAAAAAGVVTLTARHKGVVGNGIDVRDSYQLGESLPAGVGLAYALTSGGTGTPDIDALIAALPDIQYTTWCLGHSDSNTLAAVQAELESRWDGMRMIEGHAIAAAVGTQAELTTLGESVNYEHVTLMGLHRAPHPAWTWAATIAAVDAAEEDPARPRQTLELPGLYAPAEAVRFGWEERNTLLYSGISTYKVDSDGTVRIERLITLYREDSVGNEDTSYLDLETMRTLIYIRYFFRANVLSRYPRHKLADDGAVYDADQAVVTPSEFKCYLQALYAQLVSAVICEDYAGFADTLVVERDGSDPNRLNTLMQPNLVNQARVFATKIQFKI